MSLKVKLITTFLATFTCLAWAPPAFAIGDWEVPSSDIIVQPADVAVVSAMTPFSSQADFMSQAGCLRYLTFEQSGVWLTRFDAQLAVDNQIESATR